MKTKICLSVIMMCILFTGCNKNDEETTQIPSALIFKGATNEVSPRSGEVSTFSEDAESVIFTGNDILWFNGTTKEIRFKDNMYQKQTLSFDLFRSIKFYINDEYLFSSMIFASDLNSEIFSSLVFYYNIMENRFFIQDGYPDISVLHNYPEEQNLRDENMQEIEEEWGKFIDQLKQEGRYKE